MEATQLLSKIGQIAGIGGIALGVLLLLFRDVIRRNIFPTLGQSHAYRLIKLVVVLTFLISALGLGAWVYVQTKTREAQVLSVFPSSNPEPVMKSHLHLIDEEKYVDAYANASQEARRRFQKDFFISTFESQRKPLGKPASRLLYGATTMRQLPDQTQGAFAMGTFITDFSGSGKYLEAVTLIAEDGVWKVLFHQIGPCQPPFCPVKSP